MSATHTSLETVHAQWQAQVHPREALFAPYPAPLPITIMTLAPQPSTSTHAFFDPQLLSSHTTPLPTNSDSTLPTTFPQLSAPPSTPPPLFPTFFLRPPFQPRGSHQAGNAV